jgi:hypothetical protein
MKKITVVGITLFVAALFIISGCGKGDKEAAKAPEAKTPTETVEPATKVEDYLGENVVLAASQEYQDDWWVADFHPAEIITQASAETKGEYQVIAVRGSGATPKGAKYWSRHLVFKSHPAKKDELKPGMVVLFTHSTEPLSDEQLQSRVWWRARIVKTDELYKGLVEIEYEKPGLVGPVHIKNLRVCDNPKMELPE